ncbi:MAG: ketoacyl-ACP synthase III [Pirellulales bacterium]|nr:ketoacyl-ACP synthase III [Pirellulales bacterium]
MEKTELHFRRSPVLELRGARILATGSYAPERVVTNSELRERYGFDEEWIVQRTGIQERRFAAPEEATSDLATNAARQCIERSGVDPSEIDLLIVATFTPDVYLPATACLVQERLGLQCAAMDLQAACSGFVYGLVTAMNYVIGGGARYALVIGAEIISRFINPADTGTYPLFGDGAGAALVGKGSSEQGFLSYTMGSDGSGSSLITLPLGGSRTPVSASDVLENKHCLFMNGRPVFKWAIRLVHDTVQDVVTHAGLEINDIKTFIAHQANTRILDSAIDQLGIDREKVFMNLSRYGNTSAASVPLALDEAHSAGLFGENDLVLLTGFGAGLAWATGVFRW